MGGCQSVAMQLLRMLICCMWLPGHLYAVTKDAKMLWVVSKAVQFLTMLG